MLLDETTTDGARLLVDYKIPWSTRNIWCSGFYQRTTEYHQVGTHVPTDQMDLQVLRCVWSGGSTGAQGALLVTLVVVPLAKMVAHSHTDKSTHWCIHITGAGGNSSHS